MGTRGGGRGAGVARKSRLSALVPVLPAAVLLTASSAIALSAEPAPGDKSLEVKTGQIVLEIVEADSGTRPQAPAPRTKILKVQALDRSLPQKMQDKEVRIRTVEGKPVDGAPGKWLIDGLTPGSYDLCVETERGRFEGYSLVSGGAAKADAPLAAEDRGKIEELFKAVKGFEDEKRILDLAGGGDRAWALVELIRRGGTSLKPGIVTWRIERWSYEKVYGTWQRENGGHKVLRRFLVASAKEFAGWNWNFTPALGGLDIKAVERREVRWTIPEGFDPARGRAAAAGVEAPRGPPVSGVSGS